LPEASVADASPLIVLGRAARLPLLRVVANVCWVPPPVLSEVQVERQGGWGGENLVFSEWLQLAPAEPLAREVTGARLGAGEAAALSFALRRQGTVAIVDDLRARTLAQSLGVPLVGTLGVVLLAKRKGLIPKARPVIEELLAAGLYLARSRMEQALALVGE